MTELAAQGGFDAQAWAKRHEIPRDAKNAALVAACQAVEHYEIARYGTLREWAKILGHGEAHDLLTSILDQEKAANSKLTNLAVSSINEA